VRAPLYSKFPEELFTAESIDNPHPLYAALRREHPISRVGDSGVHLVATWKLIDEVLQREDDFSANLTGVLVRDEAGEPGTFEFPNVGGSNVIATADEPAHGIHRALVQPRLAAERTAALEAPLRSWVDEALSPFLAAGGGDFVPISELIPARAVARVLGLPDGDVSQHRIWAMMGGDILAGGIGKDQLVALARESGQMAEYLGAHLDATDPTTADDLQAPMLSALARGVRDGVVPRAEAVGIAIVMFGAGGESTAALIGSTIRRLAENPELAEQLRADSSLVPRFVEEVARLDPPFKFHYRAVRSQCELGGAELFPGDRLMLLWASANRDSAQFEEPDALRLNRRHSKQHMSFGRGSHFCIGAPMARLEARILIDDLLDRTSDILMDPDRPPRYAPSIFIRRHEQLPIRVKSH